MHRGNLKLIKCLICDSENYLSPTDKMVSCSNCGAPVYDHTRPANAHDFNLYRAHLASWGKSYRATTQTKSRIEKQIKVDGEERLQASQLGQKVVELQDKLNQQNQVAAKMAIESDQQSQQIITLQADLDRRNQATAKLEADLNERSGQIAALKAELDDQIQKTTKLQVDLETTKTKCESWEKTYADFRLTAAGFTKTLQTVYENQVKSIVAQLSHLIEDGSTDSGHSKGAEQNHQSNDSLLQSKHQQPKNQQPSSSLPPQDKVTQPVAEKESEHPSNPSALEHASASHTSAAQPIVPAWLEYYNNLDSPQAARDFKNRTGAESLIVSQSSLEHQRVALGDPSPVLLKGSGSYWRIYDDTTQKHFLLMNRETFRFNDTNYESITACYDFNDLIKSNIKLFKANDYKLNTYRIMQPAQVIPSESGEEWQLSLRGRLCFKKKVPA